MKPQRQHFAYNEDLLEAELARFDNFKEQCKVDIWRNEDDLLT